MKRALASIGLLFGLVLLTTKANSVCPITTTVNNNLPDTVKVGYGGTLDLDWSFTAPELPVDSCRIVGDSLQVIFDWDLQTTADCTFATDTTTVASISIVVADSVYFTDAAPLASLPPYEKKVYLGANGIANIKGRINIDASGTDCDGQFDSNVRSVYVAP